MTQWHTGTITIKGSKANPRPGDKLTVQFTNDDDSFNLTWEFDGTMTKKAFIAMVKAQTNNLLAQLNAPSQEEDASDLFHGTA